MTAQLAVPEAVSFCLFVQGHIWGARDPSILVTGGFATAPPGTVIAKAGGLDTVFLSECSGSMALSLPAPVDAHYDITLLAVRRSIYLFTQAATLPQLYQPQGNLMRLCLLLGKKPLLVWSDAYAL